MKSSVVYMMAVLSLGSAMNIVSPVIPNEGNWHLLDCPKPGTLQFFLLHGEGMAIMADTILEEEKISVWSNGSIIFQSVKVEYEGTHLCVMLHDDQTTHAHPVPLRVRPNPPEDLWAAVYESMFLTGLISAFVIALVFALGCLVYKMQWRPKSTRAEDTKPVIGYENPAMNRYEDSDSGNTKM